MPRSRASADLSARGKSRQTSRRSGLLKLELQQVALSAFSRGSLRLPLSAVSLLSGCKSTIERVFAPRTSQRRSTPRVYSLHGQGSCGFWYGLRGAGRCGGGAGGSTAPGAPPETGQGPVLGVARRQARAGRDYTGVRGSRTCRGDGPHCQLLRRPLRERVPEGGTPYDRRRRPHVFGRRRGGEPRERP